MSCTRKYNAARVTPYPKTAKIRRTIFLFITHYFIDLSF
jgi:hypothetical protein